MYHCVVVVEYRMCAHGGDTQVVVRLSHGNLVPVFDSGQVAGEIYLAMDFIEASSIESVVKSMESPPGEPQVLSWLAVCSFRPRTQPQAT